MYRVQGEIVSINFSRGVFSLLNTLGVAGLGWLCVVWFRAFWFGVVKFGASDANLR